jgi:hypothetical protein
MLSATSSSPQRWRIWLSRSKTPRLSSLTTGNNAFRFISSRQPPETKLAFQSRWNLIQVQGVKRGGYRVHGSDKVVIWFRYVFSSRHSTQMKSQLWATAGLLGRGQNKVYSASFSPLCRSLRSVDVWRQRLIDGDMYVDGPLLYHVRSQWFVSF